MNFRYVTSKVVIARGSRATTQCIAFFSYNTNNGVDITGGVVPFWTVIVALILTVIAFVFQNREALT